MAEGPCLRGATREEAAMDCMWHRILSNPDCCSLAIGFVTVSCKLSRPTCFWTIFVICFNQVDNSMCCKLYDGRSLLFCVQTWHIALFPEDRLECLCFSHLNECNLICVCNWLYWNKPSVYHYIVCRWWNWNLENQKRTRILQIGRLDLSRTM